MQNESSPKILGAFVIGFAMVAGAYTMANFSEPQVVRQEAATGITTSKAPERTFIEIVDEDNDGVEDWKDEFVTAEPVIIQTSSQYVAPDTLTGQTGVNFLQSILSSKVYSGVGRTEDEVIEDTIALVEQETSYKLYDLPDIEIIETYTDQNVRDYANAMAGVLIQNDLKGYENELDILNRVVNYGEKERVTELDAIAKAYTAMRDGSLAVPVPALFVKQHLDLINTYHAMAKDVEAMTMAYSDPLVSLMRIRRYEDDVRGLLYALQNMQVSLMPFSDLFTEDDTALLFNNYAPQGRI